MKKQVSLWAITSMVGFLAACGGGGGGGDDDNGDAIASSLAGGYSAAANNGTSGNAIVLEDGSVWNIGGVEAGGVLLVSSMTQGTIGLSGTNVTSSNLREYDFESASPLAVNFSGTVASSGVISGSLTASGFNPVSVTLTPTPSTDFNYDTPASLSAIAGTWTGFFSTGDTGSIAISSGGVVSSVTDFGCSIGGSVTPRPSGKNVYNVSLTFGPAPCALPNGSAAGIAVIVGSGAQTQLTVGATTADRSLGAAFFGSR